MGERAMRGNKGIQQDCNLRHFNFICALSKCGKHFQF